MVLSDIKIANLWRCNGGPELGPFYFFYKLTLLDNFTKSILEIYIYYTILSPY